MACDTFIKIAHKCRRHFVVVQLGEAQPFIEEILHNLSSIICDLQPQQVTYVIRVYEYLAIYCVFTIDFVAQDENTLLFMYLTLLLLAFCTRSLLFYAFVTITFFSSLVAFFKRILYKYFF